MWHAFHKSAFLFSQLRREKMLITVNGIGLTYYGKCDFDTDGNYISTKCFVFFYIPILPISSALINEQATTASSFREGNYAIITTFPVYS